MRAHSGHLPPRLPTPPTCCLQIRRPGLPQPVPERRGGTRCGLVGSSCLLNRRRQVVVPARPQRRRSSAHNRPPPPACRAGLLLGMAQLVGVCGSEMILFLTQPWWLPRIGGWLAGWPAGGCAASGLGTPLAGWRSTAWPRPQPLAIPPTHADAGLERATALGMVGWIVRLACYTVSGRLVVAVRVRCAAGQRLASLLHLLPASRSRAYSPPCRLPHRPRCSWCRSCPTCGVCCPSSCCRAAASVSGGGWRRGGQALGSGARAPRRRCRAALQTPPLCISSTRSAATGPPPPPAAFCYGVGTLRAKEIAPPHLRSSTQSLVFALYYGQFSSASSGRGRAPLDAARQRTSVTPPLPVSTRPPPCRRGPGHLRPGGRLHL